MTKQEIKRLFEENNETKNILIELSDEIKINKDGSVIYKGEPFTAEELKPGKYAFNADFEYIVTLSPQKQKEYTKR